MLRTVSSKRGAGGISCSYFFLIYTIFCCCSSGSSSFGKDLLVSSRPGSPSSLSFWSSPSSTSSTLSASSSTSEASGDYFTPASSADESLSSSSLSRSPYSWACVYWAIPIMNLPTFLYSVFFWGFILPVNGSIASFCPDFWPFWVFLNLENLPCLLRANTIEFSMTFEREPMSLPSRD